MLLKSLGSICIINLSKKEANAWKEEINRRNY